MFSRSLRLPAGFLIFALVGVSCGSSSETEVGVDTGSTEIAPDHSVELSGLELLDDMTLRVTLDQADPEFPLRLTDTSFAPLPSIFFDDPVAFEEAPIGNGAFMMDGSWNHDEQIRVVPNPDYAGPETPTVSSLTFNIYVDVCTTGFLDLQAGVVDVAECIPGDQLGSAADEFGERFATSSVPATYYYAFPSYLDDRYPLGLRRSLSMAIDRRLLTETILDGANPPAHSFIPPSLAGSRDQVCGNWNDDPDGARAAFADFGGLDALGDEPIILWFNTSESHATIAEAIANQWREVLGIENVRFEDLEGSEYLPLLDERGMTGPFRFAWGPDYLSPLSMLEPVFASYSTPPVASNNAFHDSPDFDRALADGKAAFAGSGDLHDALPFYQTAEDLLCEEARVIPIYFYTNHYAWSPGVSDVLVDATANVNWEEVTGTDVVGAIGEPQHLAPPTTIDSEGKEVLRTLFDMLVENDHLTSEPRNVVAESIETSDGGKTWTIVVADGWTFHDGEAVTARSFVDAWNWTANGANAAANNGAFAVIEGYAELNPPAEDES